MNKTTIKILVLAVVSSSVLYGSEIKNSDPASKVPNIKSYEYPASFDKLTEVEKLDFIQQQNLIVANQAKLESEYAKYLENQADVIEAKTKIKTNQNDYTKALAGEEVEKKPEVNNNQFVPVHSRGQKSQSSASKKEKKHYESKLSAQKKHYQQKINELHQYKMRNSPQYIIAREAFIDEISGTPGDLTAKIKVRGKTFEIKKGDTILNDVLVQSIDPRSITFVNKLNDKKITLGL